MAIIVPSCGLNRPASGTGRTERPDATRRLSRWQPRWVKERKDRVDDAMHATRAAVEEGIVPGGGVALLWAQKALDKAKGHDEDERTGIEIVRRALEEPIRIIAQNAGAEGAIVVGKVKESKDKNFGYNAQTDA